MRWLTGLSVNWRVLLVAAILIVGMAAVAGAAGSGIITSCVNKSTGALRIIGASGSCKATEVKLAWNIQGPPGPAGPPGAQGPPGPQGPSGVAAGFSVVSTATIPLPSTPVQVATLANLPTGTYIVNATVSAAEMPGQNLISLVGCRLSTDEGAMSNALGQDDISGQLNAGAANIAVTDALSLTAPGSVLLSCSSSAGLNLQGSGVASASAALTATQVSTINANKTAR